MSQLNTHHSEQPRRRLLILVAGIVTAQWLLFAPSLLGKKVLLPLDILAQPAVYLPTTADARPEVHNPARSDLVFSSEPARRFTGSELRAGRWPAWNPSTFAGAPSITPTISPLWLLASIIPSPVVLAWVQMLLALLAGCGMYAFCRTALGVSFWPAAIVGWCYPLTGFFVFWQGYFPSFVVAWTPWLLVAVDRAIRRLTRYGAVEVAVASFLVLGSGHLATAGQSLLVSGMYAVWCGVHYHGRRRLLGRLLSRWLLIGAGWTLGFLLASPYILPTVAYAWTGVRIAGRAAGDEERPPVGLAALPQTILPDIYGSTQRGYLPLFPQGQGNQLESSATAYAGLLATLLVAPLAWCSRRHRSVNVFWIALAVVSLAWVLDLPLLVPLLRLPLLNLMSHNRFVFAASFAVLSMAAVGLQVLHDGDLPRHWWFWLPIVLASGFGFWCLQRGLSPPEPIASQLENAIREGRPADSVATSAQLEQIKWTFFVTHAVGAALCAFAVGGWLMIWLRPKVARWLASALAALMLADLLWFAYDRSAQCDWSLYYPRIPVLAELAKSDAGRVIGVRCLPANLAQMHDLRDIRGYDGVDPARLMQLLSIAAAPDNPSPPYALSQWMVPKAGLRPTGSIRLHPLLDMLNVRYLILRGEPLPGIQPLFAGADYWVVENSAALPRVFVPRSVQHVTDPQERLKRMADENFRPREVAYVESPLNLPQPASGSAAIVSEIPTRVTIALDMKTPGLVVLADLWDQGWQAYLEGKPVPIVRADHALRGVEAPAGRATLEFRYQPASAAWGWRLCGLAAVCLAIWCWRATTGPGFARRRS